MKSFRCVNCIYYIGKLRCMAFQVKGIPEEILTGKFDHIKEYIGDNGIQFEPVIKEEELNK